MPAQRQTKIVATLGPATDPPGTIESMLAAGMDCVRINCSYGDRDDWRRRVTAVRSTEHHRRRPVPVMFDLQGLKMRLAQDTPAAELPRGAEVRLSGTAVRPVGGDGPSDTPHDAALDVAAGVGLTLRVDRDGFAGLVSDGSEIVIGDGTPRLAVLAREGDVVIATVIAPGRLGPGKGVTVTNARA
ncbi:MAG: hypothetical protein JJE27_07670, partial [Thermoleophilia bacterium]|nr:hypothetical protein [Thermoleophilia bacterium]